MGLWKEWNESTLDEMLGDSFPCFDGMGIVGVESKGGIVLSNSCGGAVIARPAFRDLGRVGVFRRSSSSSLGVRRAGAMYTVPSVASPLLASP